MNAGPMDNRHKFKASLQLAFGEEALDDRKTNIFARLMHAHRKEVADHLPTSWKSNSQLTRKRPKRERHTAETKKEYVDDAETEDVDEGEKEDVDELEKEDVDKEDLDEAEEEYENSDSLCSMSLELVSV